MNDTFRVLLDTKESSVDEVLVLLLTIVYHLVIITSFHFFRCQTKLIFHHL